jgi:hypothetical protein
MDGHEKIGHELILTNGSCLDQQQVLSNLSSQEEFQRQELKMASVSVCVTEERSTVV